jgi:hypothetical protein
MRPPKKTPPDYVNPWDEYKYCTVCGLGLVTHRTLESEYCHKTGQLRRIKLVKKCPNYRFGQEHHEHMTTWKKVEGDDDESK